jgi:hypothetical protein
LTTRIHHGVNVVNTEVGTLSLTPAAVLEFRDAAFAALTATERLVNGRLFALQTNHAYTLPMAFVEQLDVDDQRALARIGSA